MANTQKYIDAVNSLGKAIQLLETCVDQKATNPISAMKVVGELQNVVQLLLDSHNASARHVKSVVSENVKSAKSSVREVNSKRRRGGQGKKKTGGADAELSKVFNTSDLITGDEKMYDATHNNQALSLQYLPAPFSSGSMQSFDSTMNVLTPKDVTRLNPPVVAGGKSKKRHNKK